MNEVTANTRVRRVHVGQGEHVVSTDPNVVLSTILGSCAIPRRAWAA